MLTDSGILTNDATRDVRDALRTAAEQFPPGPLIIGVKVVNAGRAPFHVADWELRAEPHGAKFKVLGDPIGSPAVPCNIPAGAQRTFFMRLDGARNLASGSEEIASGPQRIAVTVSSGGRTYVSKSVEPMNLTLGQV